MFYKTHLINSVIIDGYEFETKLEAQWYVFFKECGLKPIYKPGAFNMDGHIYTPTFFLPHAYTRLNPSDGLFVSVKRKLEADDIETINRFTEFDLDLVEHCSVLIVNYIPRSSTFDDLVEEILFSNDSFYNFQYVDGDYFGALPCVGKKGFTLCGDTDLDEADKDKTMSAYFKARNAKF